MINNLGIRTLGVLIMSLFCLFSKAQNVNIPDANFKAALVANNQINTNGDDEISVVEASSFRGYMDVERKNISDMTGIEKFVNLVGLNCNNNTIKSLNLGECINLLSLKCTQNSLENLDLSKNTKLRLVEVFSNYNLSHIELGNNPNLSQLNVIRNKLSSLDVTSLPNLRYLFCSSNKIENLDITQNQKLISLSCGNNRLGFLDVSHNLDLQYLICDGMRLKSLNVEKNILLKSLHCSYNNFGSLDISKNINLETLWCVRSNLTKIDISKNLKLKSLSINENKLPFSQLAPIYNRFNTFRYESSLLLFERKYEKCGYVWDFSSEAELNGVNTVFEWINGYGQKVGVDVVKPMATKGVFKFLKAGNYYCKMTNPNFKNSSEGDLSLKTQFITISKKNQTVNWANNGAAVKVNDVITLSGTATSTLPVTFQVVSGKATITGNKITFDEAGTVTVKAIQIGNDEYNRAESATIQYSVTKRDQTVTFNNAPIATKVNDTVTLSATATSKLPVTFQVVSGNATLTNNQLHFNEEGTVVVKAIQSGNVEFNAGSITTSIAVTKRDQTVAFNNAPTATKVNDTVTLSATATSKLPVTFQVVSGNATLANNQLHFNEEGTVVVKAIQAGNVEFNAGSITTSITATKRDQTVAFNNVPTATKVNDTVTLSATASSKLPVTFQIVSGNATLTNNQLHFNEEGTVVVKAIQSGNVEFNAGSITTSITVTKRDQAINVLNNLNNIKVEDQLVFEARSTSGLPVSYELKSNNAELNGNNIRFKSEGVVTVKATVKGNVEYHPGELTIQIAVSKRNQTVRFQNNFISAEVTDVRRLSATASSKLPVKFQLISGDADLIGNELTFRQEGTVKVKAVQEGNYEYEQGGAIIDIAVARKAQTISIDNSLKKVRVNDLVTFKAIATSEEIVEYHLLEGYALIDGNEITFKQEGKVKVKAIQKGNYKYLPVEELIDFEVEKREQTLSFESFDKNIAVNEWKELIEFADSGLPVKYELVNGEAEIDGFRIKVKNSGTVILKATQSGNYEYLPLEEEVELNADQKNQNIEFMNPIETAFVNSTWDCNVKSSSELPVELEVISGEAELADNELLFTRSGEVKIRAYQKGNNEYFASEKIITILVQKRNQTVDVQNEIASAYVNDELTLKMTCSSNLPMECEILTNNAEIKDGTIIFSQAGTVEICVTQAGNNEFDAVEKTLTVEVSKRNQTIALDNLVEQVSVNDVQNFTAKASSDLPVVFEVVEGEANIADDAITFTQAGTVKIKATQSGNNEFESTEMVFTVEVSKKNQTITLASEVTTAKVNDLVELSAWTTSGLDLKYEIVSGDAELDGSELKCTEEGTVIVKIIQSGNEEYNATELTHTIQVSKKQQQITFDGATAFKVNDTVTLNAITNSGLQVTYELGSGEATIDNETLQFTAAGKVVIRATQQGNNEFEATNLDIEFTVEKKEQHITVDEVADAVKTGDVITLNATTDSGLEIHYEVIEGDATIVNNHVVCSKAGTIKVRVVQEGNNEFDACEKIITLNVTGITKEDEACSFKFYPNPIVNQFHIDFRNQCQRTIFVYDLVGNLVLQKDFDAAKSEFDFSFLRNGTYIMKVKTQMQTLTHKIVKQ
ncbi:T9SS type A sorting domain-containing protein [Prolixibacteraceae bacterium JC049]|nr:T9SS type A sorting domain-containing protein [Prolixibacteraceae bacterium JC049]